METEQEELASHDGEGTGELLLSQGLQVSGLALDLPCILSCFPIFKLHFPFCEPD